MFVDEEGMPSLAVIFGKMSIISMFHPNKQVLYLGLILTVIPNPL